jgi:hypothetical protein
MALGDHFCTGNRVWKTCRTRQQDSQIGRATHLVDDAQDQLLVEPPILQRPKHPSRRAPRIASSNHVRRDIYADQLDSLSDRDNKPDSPGMSRASFLLARSFVSDISSAVRGVLGGRRTPPDHKLSWKPDRARSMESGATTFRKESRTFLQPQKHISGCRHVDMYPKLEVKSDSPLECAP